VKLLGHPQVTKIVVSRSSSWPDAVFQHVLFVETTIPLSQKQEGYDHARLASFIEVVGKYMEEVATEEAKIVSTDWTSCVQLTNPALEQELTKALDRRETA
jgi:hypothetical protein